MKTRASQQQTIPTSEAIDLKNSTDKQYMGKDVTVLPSQKMLKPPPHSKTLQSKSLYQLAVDAVKPLVHFFLHHETLSNRIRIIEDSRLRPQRRLPFLNANLENIAKKFNGDGATELFDFSRGCCFGLTSNYILFEVFAEHEKFDKILSTLSQDPKEGWTFWGMYYPNLADAIALAQDELRKKPDTTDPDTLLLIELRPFCESLLLFQSPKDTALSSSIPFQDINAAAQLTASESLEDDAVFQSTPYNTAGLTPEGVESLLLKIRTTVDEQLPERLFHISSGGHIIALKVSSQGYEVFDQNIANYKKFFPIGDEKKLASFLGDRVQGMPWSIRLPFHENIVFQIREHYSEATSSTIKTKNQELKNLLKEIPDAHQCHINEHNFHGYNQLHLAAWNNNTEEITLLLKNNDLALNNFKSENMETALHLAYAGVIPKGDLIDLHGNIYTH